MEIAANALPTLAALQSNASVFEPSKPTYEECRGLQKDTRLAKPKVEAAAGLASPIATRAIHWSVKASGSSAWRALSADGVSP